MAIYRIDTLELDEGNEFQINPPTPTTEDRGGFLAQLDNDYDNPDNVEVKLGADEKGYVNTAKDYNQNDETASDYIKNRPFYTTDPMDTVLVEETTINRWALDSTISDNSLGAPISYNDIPGNTNPMPLTTESPYRIINVDQTYKVTWDGSEYELICQRDDNRYINYIGSLDFSEYPFFICDTGFDTLSVFISGTEAVSTVINETQVTVITGVSHTVKVTTIAPHDIQIDERYIPDSIARTSTLEAVNRDACKKSDLVKHQTTLTYNGFNYRAVNTNGYSYIYFLTSEGLWYIYSYSNCDGETYKLKYDSTTGILSSYRIKYDEFGIRTENEINVICAILYDVNTGKKIRSITGQKTLTIGTYTKISGNIPLYIDDVSNTLYTLHSFDDVQSDWNQNSETSSSYVKNRTHYTKDPVNTVILEEQSIAISQKWSNTSYALSDISTNHPLVLGQRYTVVWDGTVYENLECFDNNGRITIGATYNDFSTYPFGVYNDEYKYGYLVIEISSSEFASTEGGSAITSVNHTIQISTMQSEVVELDEKYISYKPGKIVTGKSFTYDEQQYTANYGAEVFNDCERNIAIGKFSHAEGQQTIASGEASHAEGSQTTASGINSHAEGFKTTASGNGSHVEGYNTTAYGNYSHAEGSGTTASGVFSHAEGFIITASGQSSHAEGQQTIASGEASHAEGSQTTASGYKSHAEGSNTTASGEASHAEGYYTTASGKYSHAEGEETTASGINQHVQGKYNIEDTENKYAHIVGNGTSNTARSNAHTVDWNGNAWYKGNIYVGGDSQDNGDKVATERYVNSTPRTEIPLTDEANKHTYIITMDNGQINSFCACESIEILTLPTNLQISAADGGIVLEGLSVTAICQDGSTRDITKYFVEEPYTINGKASYSTNLETGIVELRYFELGNMFTATFQGEL